MSDHASGSTISTGEGSIRKELPPTGINHSLGAIIAVVVVFVWYEFVSSSLFMGGGMVQICFASLARKGLVFSVGFRVEWEKQKMI